MTKQEFEQEQYEDILAKYWQKLAQLKELKETNSNNNPLRLKSISDREKELDVIKNQKIVLEQISEYILEVPEWYADRVKQ